MGGKIKKYKSGFKLLEEELKKKEKNNGWGGKVGRFVKSIVYPVEEGRKGECKQCGACCEIAIRCPFLYYKEEDGKKLAKCFIYPIRFPHCKKYPRSRENFPTEEVCGYRFG